MRAPTDWRVDFRVSRLVKAQNSLRGYDPQVLASKGMAERVRRHPHGRHVPNPWIAHPMPNPEFAHPLIAEGGTLFLVQLHPD